jgi:hypothetical protein
MAYVTVVMDLTNGLALYISPAKLARILGVVQMFAWKWEKKNGKSVNGWLK